MPQNNTGTIGVEIVPASASAVSTGVDGESDIAGQGKSGIDACEDGSKSALGGREPSKGGKKKKDAFTELMSPKKPAKNSTWHPRDSSHASDFTSSTANQPPPHKRVHTYHGRMGLGVYIANPSAFPSTTVLWHNENFVLVHDLYPKASVHTLLLPRSTDHIFLHPFDAFDDADFLASVRAAAEEGRRLVASEMRRRFGKYAARDTAREAALRQDPPPDEFPPGRDWASEVMVGIHAGPSMSHLHVHILSPDRVSPCLRHKKHYNSFSTPFFVPLQDFPLAEEDPRRRRGWFKEQGFLRGNMRCWRCGEVWDKAEFAELKRHLEEEMERWIRD